MRTVAHSFTTVRTRSNAPSTPPAANSTASSRSPSAKPDSYPQIPRTRLYAKAEGFAGPIRVALVSNDGATVHASAQVPRVTGSWKKYEVILTTGAAKPSAENRLVISAGSAGTVWFSMVSLFPPTWNNRPNGNRKDIMQILA